MCSQTTCGSQAFLSRRQFLRYTALLATTTATTTLISGRHSSGTAMAVAINSSSLSLPSNTWVARTVPEYPASPGPWFTKHMRLTFDSSSRLVYLWGGDDCVADEVFKGSRCNSREEFYSYDVATDRWTMLLTQTQALRTDFPKGRCLAGFVYDPKRNLVWMTGGQVRFEDYAMFGVPVPQDGGLWAFNPTTRIWTREGPDPFSESTKVDHFAFEVDNSMGYDATSDSLFIVKSGRIVFYPLSQVVVGDGKEQDLWFQSPLPFQDPYLDGYVIQHAVDTKRNRAVIYSPKNGETWSYDFKTKTATRLSQQRLPQWTYFTMVYDSINDVIVVVGGIMQDGTPIYDVWVFDPKTNQWSKHSVSGDISDPDETKTYQMTFDSYNNVVVMYFKKIYLLRLGVGTTPPDTIPPAAPTNLQVR